MTKLAQTLGLTEFQTEIIATVRQFVEKEVIPHAAELERTDDVAAAADAIVDAVRRNRSVVPVGAEARVGWYLRGLMPTRFADLLARTELRGP